MISSIDETQQRNQKYSLQRTSLTLKSANSENTSYGWQETYCENFCVFGFIRVGVQATGVQGA